MSDADLLLGTFQRALGVEFFELALPERLVRKVEPPRVSSIDSFVQVTMPRLELLQRFVMHVASVLCYLEWVQVALEI